MTMLGLSEANRLKPFIYPEQGKTLLLKSSIVLETKTASPSQSSFDLHFQRTFAEITSAFEQILDSWNELKVPQPVSLQLLFDLKFIGAACGSQLEEKYSKLEHRIEQMVSTVSFYCRMLLILIKSSTIKNPNIGHTRQIGALALTHVLD